MDESSPQSRVKTVQDLVAGGESVPDKYLHKDGVVGSGNHVPLVDIPVIDLSLLLSPSPSAGDELDKLRSALASWGCFQAVNHGMSGLFLDRVREITRGFFYLPAEEKLRYSRAEDDIEGYGTDMVLFDEQVLDWTDRLYLTIHPEDQRKPKFWPEKPESFREVLQEYSAKLSVVLEIMLRAMALSLKLEEGCFIDQFGEPRTIFARFNYYPQCTRPDTVLGLKPHSDGSALTILLPDKEVEGLQFLREGKWVGIRIIPEALVINMGDQVEIMTNGVFTSPTHRAATNATRDRLSIAAFCAPSSEKEIGPINELISEATPRLYKNIKNYPETYFKYYQLGRRPIEAVKI